MAGGVGGGGEWGGDGESKIDSFRLFGGWGGEYKMNTIFRLLWGGGRGDRTTGPKDGKRMIERK